MTSSYHHLLVERAGHVAVVTVNRPEKLNALNRALLGELLRAMHELVVVQGGAEPVRAAILTGAGKAFVAGADIEEMSEMPPAEAKRFADLGHRVCHLLESAPFPVLAAVNGFALGGGLELALACDFLYAAEGAKLGQPEVGLGVIPGFGGTQRLTRRVGPGRARELIYTGRTVTAAEAQAMGLVQAVVPGDALLARARETAALIAEKGPLAVAAAKRVILRGADLELTAAAELEAQAFSALFGSEDQRHGMRTFLDKKRPTFQGR